MDAIDNKPRPLGFDLAPYARIARFDHWVKNVFVLPGAAFAYAMVGGVSFTGLFDLLIGLLATGFAASANYTINEYLDAEFDRLHPLKRSRPGAQGHLVPRLVFLEHLVFAALALLIGWRINAFFLGTIAALLVMGVLYNVQPLRTKDRMLLDVISESVNNPLRFLLGWFALTSASFPPSSILISYWAGGAFLMGMKRYAEYRQIGDRTVAGSYRRSFRHYTERSLLVSSFFYALNATFFLGIFLVKYRVEYILLFPFISLLFVEYVLIAMRDGSSAYSPEKLYRERRLMGILAVVVMLSIALLLVRLPFLSFLLERVDVSGGGV